MKLSFFRFFENLLFPPRCVSCRGFLQKDILDPCLLPLCPTCRIGWEREKGEPCPDCGLDMSFCRCLPERMKRAGISKTIKLVNYQTARSTVGRRAILYMKKHFNAAAFSFFAEQLSHSVKKHMEEKGVLAEEVAFCHVPRGRKSVSLYGFDQAKQISRHLAAACGTRSVSLFVRKTRFGIKEKEQKKLSGRARTENVKGKFGVEKRILSTLKSVKLLFLVDDIVTTGSSICGCAELLKKQFDGDIVVVSIARTPLGRRHTRF